MPRPDQSFYLAHFTKNGKDYDPTNHLENPSINQMSAFERLISILQQRKITAASLPWTKKPAVCFTECPWGSLLRHADHYSPYGIGFTKKLIYSRKGNPVIYANPDLFESQDWSNDVYPFVTPFVPTYASDSVKTKFGKIVDFTHEREWRIPRDFSFQYYHIKFIILKSIEDLRNFPEGIVKEIGLDKFIFMDTYKKIEELWPTHVME